MNDAGLGSAVKVVTSAISNLLSAVQSTADTDLSAVCACLDLTSAMQTVMGKTFTELSGVREELARSEARNKRLQERVAKLEASNRSLDGTATEWATEAGRLKADMTDVRFELTDAQDTAERLRRLWKTAKDVGVPTGGRADAEDKE